MSKICYILAIDEKDQYLELEVDKKNPFGKSHIRRVQEVFEKHYPVFTVTQHELVRSEVCDYISPESLDKTELVLALSELSNRKKHLTIILDGSRTYSEDHVFKYLDRKGTFIL